MGDPNNVFYYPVNSNPPKMSIINYRMRSDVGRHAAEPLEDVDERGDTGRRYGLRGLVAAEPSPLVASGVEALYTPLWTAGRDTVLLVHAWSWYSNRWRLGSVEWEQFTGPVPSQVRADASRIGMHLFYDLEFWEAPGRSDWMLVGVAGEHTFDRHVVTGFYPMMRWGFDLAPPELIMQAPVTRRALAEVGERLVGGSGQLQPAQPTVHSEEPLILGQGRIIRAHRAQPGSRPLVLEVTAAFAVVAVIVLAILILLDSQDILPFNLPFISR